MVLFLGLSIFDPNFRKIVTKPDNVPIVGMLFLVPFFTWFSLREAVRNDQRTEEGKPLIEQEETAEKVLTWPDLVYTELICMVVLTVILIGWSMALQAPLEEPANPSSFAESVESAVVLPRTSGNAGVFRSVAGRRGVSRA